MLSSIGSMFVPWKIIGALLQWWAACLQLLIQELRCGTAQFSGSTDALCVWRLPLMECVGTVIDSG